jgi:hypothetical protein
MDIIEKYPISYFLTPPSLFNFILPISKDLHVTPFSPNISTFPLLIKLYETTLGRGSFPPWVKYSPLGPFVHSTF